MEAVPLEGKFGGSFVAGMVGRKVGFEGISVGSRGNVSRRLFVIVAEAVGNIGVLGTISASELVVAFDNSDLERGAFGGILPRPVANKGGDGLCSFFGGTQIS